MYQEKTTQEKKKRKRSLPINESMPAEDGGDAADAGPALASEEKPARKPAGRKAVQKAQAGFDQPLESPEAKVCCSSGAA